MPRWSDPVAQGALPAKEVAHRLKVNVETIRRWARSGELRVIRWGRGGAQGGIYVRPSEVDRFLKTRGL